MPSFWAFLVLLQHLSTDPKVVCTWVVRFSLTRGTRGKGNGSRRRGFGWGKVAVGVEGGRELQRRKDLRKSIAFKMGERLQLCRRANRRGRGDRLEHSSANPCRSLFLSKLGTHFHTFEFLRLSKYQFDGGALFFFSPGFCCCGFPEEAGLLPVVLGVVVLLQHLSTYLMQWHWFFFSESE